MIIVINATLAGGACMGAPGSLINYPFCAMIVGFVCGMISSLGYTYAWGFFRRCLKLHDSQGVQWAFGVPGIIGGFVSAISCSFADSNFGQRYN